MQRPEQQLVGSWLQFCPSAEQFPWPPLQTPEPHVLLQQTVVPLHGSPLGVHVPEELLAVVLELLAVVLELLAVVLELLVLPLLLLVVVNVPEEELGPVDELDVVAPPPPATSDPQSLTHETRTPPKASAESAA